ncbi:MAG TPA: ESX secretion-associated protein EspG [Mycobacteriales bacterium]|nr:ESX secretion-associated protein EspG [Mycobacteriales bacterium]
MELDASGDALRLDVRPFPFQFPVHGELVEERIRLIQAVHDTLTAKGLIEGRRFAPELEDLVGLFAGGRVAVAVVGNVDGAGLCARAVTDGRSAVLAVECGQAISFESVTPPSMVRSVLGLLPVLRPGPGRSVTVTVDEPVSVGRHRTPEEDLSDRRYLQPVRPKMDSTRVQEAIVDEIMRRPRVGSGYMTVTARSRNGRESEPVTMSWLDTDAGRYAVLPSVGPDGRLHVTYTPADQSRLDQSLSRLVELMT